MATTGLITTPTAGQKYFTDNPDVAAAYSSNPYGLSQADFANLHYSKYGQAEGRTLGGAVTTPTAGAGAAYFAANPDVVAAYSQNNALSQDDFARVHYSKFGAAEGRTLGASTDGGSATVVGGAGKDTVTSGAGKDTVTSGAGKDTVTSGAGNDTVTSTAVVTAPPAAVTAAPPTVVTAPPAAVTAAPVPYGVTPTMLVQDRIQGIIAENSPLMQQARAASLGQMNERGLINSSIAITAGQKAVYDAAMPIAQADAAMYADTAKTNNAYANQFATANNVQIRDLQKMATAQGYNLDTMGAQQINDMVKLNTQILATTARDKSAIEADKATAAAAVKEAATVAAKRVETDNAATKLETDNAQILLNYKLASEAQNTYNTTFNAINTSADDPVTKKTKIDAAWNQYKNTIANVRAASSVAGLAQLVNFATGAGPGVTAPGANPTTDTPGLTNDAKWEAIVKAGWDAHVAKFGVGWDTSRTTPAERAANLQRMQAQYNA